MQSGITSRRKHARVTMAARREEAERVRSRAFGRRRNSCTADPAILPRAARNLPPPPPPAAEDARDPDSSATDVRVGFALGMPPILIRF